MAHIRANPKVSVYYCDPGDYRGLTLIGDAVIEDGIEIKKAIWDPDWTFYYPEGIRDPDFCLVSLKPKNAKYYHRLEGCDFEI